MIDADMANIEQALGLHERITILYAVDGFEARLHHENETGPERIGFGATIIDALHALDRNCA